MLDWQKHETDYFIVHKAFCSEQIISFEQTHEADLAPAEFTRPFGPAGFDFCCW